ncbi:MAG TPA: response regulator, partial [Thermosulfidibacter takaii]|nr:response regulator [Thermosulfidibacter takaii]
DLILPGLGGKEVSYRIKEVSPQTRILFISGYSPGSLHPKYRPEGETAFLQKPFTPRELLNKVGELMK